MRGQAPAAATIRGRGDLLATGLQRGASLDKVGRSPKLNTALGIVITISGQLPCKLCTSLAVNQQVQTPMEIQRPRRTAAVSVLGHLFRGCCPVLHWCGDAMGRKLVAAVRRPTSCSSWLTTSAGRTWDVTATSSLKHRVIDTLAADGMRFTSAYTAPVCTPSRGMILSGQSSARTGLYKVPFQGNDRPWAKVVPPEPWGDRPVDAKPLGALLSGGRLHVEAGGKSPCPNGLHGRSGRHRPIPQKPRPLLERRSTRSCWTFPESNPGKQVGPITRQAIEFIASNRDRPFFCYVGHHVPHIPLVAREELTEEVRSQMEASARGYPPALCGHVRGHG